MSMIEAGPYVYVNRPPLKFITSEPDKIAMASYDKVIPWVLGPYKIGTLMQRFQSILKDDVTVTISTDLIIRV